MNPNLTAEEKREQALAMLKANPSLAASELERRKQNRERKSRGEPTVSLTEKQMPLVTLGKDDLKQFLVRG